LRHRVCCCCYSLGAWKEGKRKEEKKRKGKEREGEGKNEGAAELEKRAGGVESSSHEAGSPSSSIASLVLLAPGGLTDDPPGLLAYHTGVLRSFIVYRLWTERCRKHFDDKYSLKATLTQAWVATVEVGMASWKAIRSQRLTKDQDTQTSIEFIFRKEWLRRSIMGTNNATIRWHFLPPLYFLPLINV
jgi:hypothetical protein